MAERKHAGHGAGPEDRTGPAGQISGEGFDRELEFRPIVHAGVWTAVICVVAFVAMLAMYRWMIGLERAGDPAPSPIPEAAVRQLPPEPRLQRVPEKDLAALRAEQRTALETYGWVDRPAGIARIPIDRAIELVAERGLPRTPSTAIPTPGAGATP